MIPLASQFFVLSTPIQEYKAILSIVQLNAPTVEFTCLTSINPHSVRFKKPIRRCRPSPHQALWQDRFHQSIFPVSAKSSLPVDQTTGARLTMACLFHFCKQKQKQKGNILRKQQPHPPLPNFDPILNASAYAPPPLVSEDKTRDPTASSLFLKWLPPFQALGGGPRSPKPKYPTTRDMPIWLATTPVRTSFLTAGNSSDAIPPFTYRGLFTAPRSDQPSEDVRPEDLYLNWLPSPPAEATTRAPRAAIDASMNVATWVHTSAEEHVRVVDISASSSMRGESSANGKVLEKRSSSRLAIDATTHVATWVYSSTDTVSVIDIPPSRGKGKGKARLSKPLPPTPKALRLPSLTRVSGFSSTLAIIEHIGRGIPAELEAMVAIGESARGKRSTRERAGSAMDLLKVLESYDWFFESGFGEVERCFDSARGTLEDLERYDFFFE